MSSSFKIFSHETGAEILKAIRAPEFILPTMIMPVAFYFLFGVAMSGDSNQALYLLASYGIFAVMGPAIFSFGGGVAQERERGWLQLTRTSPAPASIYIAAKLFACISVSALSLALVYAVAGFVAAVALPRATWLALLIVHLLATIPFVFLGLTIGFTLRSTAAIAVSNLFFLTLAALGGLWLPVFLFPSYLQSFAQFLPSFHLAEIGLVIVGAPGERTLMPHILATIIASAFFLSTALFAWHRQR